MGIGAWMNVIDTVGGLVQIARRVRQGGVSGLASGQMSPGALGPIETRLAGVVVAALKEAFDRDSARLELERSQIDAERRRAEEALQAELRRQAADRVLGQLRLIAVIAVAAWGLSAALGVWLPGMRETTLPRAVLGAGWLFALAALASAFAGWRQVSLRAADTAAGVALDDTATTYAPWLLVASLALTGAGLLLAL
jgi:hypothetical protein